MGMPYFSANSMTTLAALTPLGDLVHRGDDLLDGLALSELLADVPVAAALAGAGDDQVAHAGQAREGVRCPPIASPSFDISRIARAITIARVFSPMPSE